MKRREPLPTRTVFLNLLTRVAGGTEYVLTILKHAFSQPAYHCLQKRPVKGLWVTDLSAKVTCWYGTGVNVNGGVSSRSLRDLMQLNILAVYKSRGRKATRKGLRAIKRLHGDLARHKDKGTGYPVTIELKSVCTRLDLYWSLASRQPSRIQHE